MTETKVCEGFAWVGQPINCCDNCGRPAWDHDFDERPARGPYGIQRPWELVPWSAERIAHWLLAGRISRERAAQLLTAVGRVTDQ